MSRNVTYAVTGVVVILMSGLILNMFYGYRNIYLPGETTIGHKQFEDKCEACHQNGFSTSEKFNEYCNYCHGEGLIEGNDSHPIKLFNNPRYSNYINNIDARYCISCHTEHNKNISDDMGVNVPLNYCIDCHQDIYEDRVTHESFDEISCSNVGCHNYHDNSSLNDKYLLSHKTDNYINESPMVLTKNIQEQDIRKSQIKHNHIDTNIYLLDAKDGSIDSEHYLSLHNKNGIECKGCHEVDVNGLVLNYKLPDHVTCKKCHKSEVQEYLESKYGARLYLGMSPTTPEMSHLEINIEHKNTELSCTVCHKSHAFDIKMAAVDACLDCHIDKHSVSYKSSLHYRIWQDEMQGLVTEGMGVSCATCHLPRKEYRENGNKIIKSVHNTSYNIRPNEKMIRTVCIRCHGVSFSIDSIADQTLIDNNFIGKPSYHVESIDMAIKSNKNSSN